MTATIPRRSAAPAPARPPPSRSRTCRSPTWSAASRDRCCAASRSRSRRARRTAWSVSPAAASPRRPTPRSATCPRNGRITGGRILVDGDDITKMRSDEVRQFRTNHASMVYQDPGGGPEPDARAIGPQVDRGVHGPRPEPGRGAARTPWPPCDRVKIADPIGSSTATRTSCRAGCSSASSSPWPWPPTRSCSSSTNRRPASTRRSRRASSTSSGRCATRRTPRSCSSPTTSGSSAPCATGSA